MKYILRPALTMLITAVIVIALLSVVHAFTLEPIERQRIAAQERAMQEVLPGATEYLAVDTQFSGNIIGIYRGLAAGQTIGYVIELAAPGYVEDIHIMVGISSANEQVSGMRVLRHRETPGLGSVISRESFYRRFDNIALVPLTVVRGGNAGEHQIDSIASATITTVAVTNAVNEAIQWYLEGGAAR